MNIGGSVTNVTAISLTGAFTVDNFIVPTGAVVNQKVVLPFLAAMRSEHKSQGIVEVVFTKKLSNGSTGVMPAELQENTVYFLRIFGLPLTDLYPLAQCDLATTANVPLQNGVANLSTYDVFDANNLVSSTAGYEYRRVLLKNQTDARQNGVYYYPLNGSSMLDRTVDTDNEQGPELRQGAYTQILNGVANGGKFFVLATPDPIVPNVTSQTWVNLFGSSVIVRCYAALADAQSDNNRLTPVFAGPFGLITVISKKYDPIDCREWAAATVEDIACCPEPPALNVGTADTATLTIGSDTLILKRGQRLPFYYYYKNQLVWSFHQTFYHGWSAHADYTPTGWTGTKVFFTLDFKNALLTTANNYNFPTQQGANRWLSPANFTGDLLAGIPHLTARWYSVNQDGLPVTFLSHQVFVGSASINSTNSMTFHALDRSLYTSLGSNFLPTSIPVSFSGATTLPPQARLYMPDAWFAHPTYPVQLGTINEILTLDSATGVYASEVKEYYKIPGRLHVATRFSPTIISGRKYIGNDAQAGNLGSGKYTVKVGYSRNININGTPLNVSPIPNNTWAVGMGQVFCNNNYYQPNFTEQHTLIHVANDNHGGMVTGLAQGTPFFDTRVRANQKQETSADYVYEIDASNFGIVEVAGSLPIALEIAYSQYDSARYPIADGDPRRMDFYKTNRFAVSTLHGKAFFSSLEL